MEGSNTETIKTKNNNIINLIIQSILSKQKDHTELFNMASKENLLSDVADTEDDHSRNIICSKLLL